MRYILAIIAGLLIAAGAAQGQIAAPLLAPLQPGSFTANPATLQWSGSSYLGAAVLSGEFSATSGGVTNPIGEGDLDGTVLQLRAVGEMFSVGVEKVDIEVTLGNATAGGNIEVSAVNAGLAALITDSISVGVGMENVEEDTTVTAPVALPTTTDESSVTVFGTAVRLTDTIFLGAALGTETVTLSGSTTEIDRDIMRAGVAILSISSGFSVHLEAYMDNQESFDVPQSGGGVAKIDEHKSTSLVAEVIWNNILLGVHLFNINETDVDEAGVTTSDDDISETLVVVGWVPEGGLSIVGSLSTAKTDDNVNSGEVAELDVISLGVAYLF